MVNVAEDITIVLSGGATNIKPDWSLGGLPSSAPITDASLNNLFDDVSPDEAEEGHEDYRCIYFFNDGPSAVYEIEVWVYEDFEGGATVELGIQESDEIQRITISDGPVTGGSMDISFSGYEITSYYEDLQDWATSLEDSLNALPILRDVEVRAQNVGADQTIFDVVFGGRDGSRNHPVISIVNNLVPNTTQISVATTLEGAPVNTIAPEIDVETTPPGGVGFFQPTEQSPISIPRMDPTDGFPLWIKRVVEEETGPKEQDGFKLRFSAQTLEPAAS